MKVRCEKCGHVGELAVEVKDRADGMKEIDLDDLAEIREPLRLTAKDAKTIFDALDDPPHPNERLLKAFRDHMKQVQGDEETEEPKNADEVLRWLGFDEEPDPIISGMLEDEQDRLADALEALAMKEQTETVMAEIEKIESRIRYLNQLLLSPRQIVNLWLFLEERKTRK